MGLQVFFDNFTLLANAPNGVAKLRELILQLAVEGKLCPQNTKDESATALLRRIVAEKAKLQGIPSNAVLVTEIPEPPYPIPRTWVWSSLKDVGLINPRNQFDDDELASFVPMKLVPQKYGDIVRTEKRVWKEIKNGFTHFAEGDVALAKITPCFQNGKAAVMRGLENNIGAGTTELHVFRPVKGLMFSEYVLVYLKSPQFILDGIPRMTGTAGQKRVPNDYFALNPFPLPPLEEQKRIVAKVEELMRLCDELEGRQQARRESRVGLNKATLAPLNKAASLAPQELQQASARLAANFATLYESAETVGNLRSTILQLAVQGKLVPQDPNDEPETALIERLKKTKTRLIKEKRIRKEGALPPINYDELHYSLPTNWQWVRVDEISDVGTGSTPLSSNNEYYYQGTIAWVTSAATSHKYIYDADTRITPKAVTDYRLRLYPVGTLVIALYGQGKTRGQISQLKIDATINQACAAISLIETAEEHSAYVRRFFEKAYEEIRALAAGGAQPNLNLRKIKETIIPLPPLAEQKRIVAKVNQLMTLCDELEAKLFESEADSEKLMNAAVQHVLESIVPKRTSEVAVAFT